MGSLEMRGSLGLAVRWDCTLIMQMNSHGTMLHPQSFQSSFLETKMSCELSPRFVTHYRRVIGKEEFYDEFQIVGFMKLCWFFCCCKMSDLTCIMSGKTAFHHTEPHCFLPILTKPSALCHSTLVAQDPCLPHSPF